MHEPIAFANGHFTTKAEGDTLWQGALDVLPRPRPITALAAAQAMFADGCVQFPDLLSAPEIAALRQWMDAAGGPDDAQYEVAGWCYNRLIMGELHRDPVWLQLIDRSPLTECLQYLLGDQVHATSGAMWTTGKGRAMGLHTDSRTVALPEEMHADPRVRMPLQAVIFQYYLDDQVEDIGPTVVVPGSWRSGRHPRDEGAWNGRQPAMVSVSAGGGVLFRPDLWHGAALNRSTRRRYVIQVQFGHAGLRQGYPPPYYRERYAPAVLAQLTPRLIGLLGGERP